MKSTKRIKALKIIKFIHLYPKAIQITIENFKVFKKTTVRDLQFWLLKDWFSTIDDWLQ